MPDASRRCGPQKSASKELRHQCPEVELGDINYLSLLNAQQTYQQALINLAQTQALHYADTVALFQALGGGWWNRADAEPEHPLSIGDFFQ